MGFFRGSGLVLVSIILFVCFLCTGIFATLNFSLSHSAVQNNAQPLIKSFLGQQIVNYDELESKLKNYCINNSEYIINDVNSGFDIAVQCDSVNEGKEAVLNNAAYSLVDQVYYKKYSCEFLDCFSQANDQPPFFLISEHTKDFFKKQFYTILIISFIFGFLAFLLIRNKFNLPILLGSLLIISFIPVLLISKLVFFIVSNFSSNSLFDLNSIILIFFSKADLVFFSGLALGLILIGFGILLKIRLGNDAGYFGKGSE